ncbi:MULTISPECIES: MmcQ/YjbR family DNA-binding protein [unclassified Massilia]|uniref:MmcQ/YjbR family DNA-binding protein n=1 Tax=unclassified Massilia TaxID=2609279 RepID=UPI00067D841A|nr:MULTISPECIES: MmcQ/YjbR family DNA-binding protein [unclassified Massilia]AKU23185.1 hypothetical protein ACZ75_18705 [Massilia sp. NR 4-1]UMR31903.1 MmcQ/YjbR family DNA-binding protein [Massilia sp. MB5]UTY57112.1 MmcQ/YjbR family DNA-binding protein [Massilia sp. erpn]
MNLNKAKTFCRSLPGAIESVKWGEVLVFTVGEKMFACTDADGESNRISFKVEDERFLELSDRPGFVPAPYLARAKWVMIEDVKTVAEDEAKALLRRSYELVFAKLSKKMQREIGEQV